MSAAHKSHLFKLPRPGNLVGFWPTREGTGTTTKDLVGGNDGTLVNTPAWTQGADGQWYTNFVAADSKSISLGNPAALRLGVFTWALLVTPTLNISDNTYRPFLGAYNAAGSRSNYTLNMNRSGLANGRKPYLEFSNSAGSVHALSGTTLLSAEVQYLLVVSFDGTTSKIYVDGALENSGTPGFSPDTTTAVDIAFGKNGAFAQYSSHAHHWGAAWDVALDASEVAYLSTLGSF
jgi:hypothetical protein